MLAEAFLVGDFQLLAQHNVGDHEALQVDRLRDLALLQKAEDVTFVVLEKRAAAVERLDYVAGADEEERAQFYS